MAINPTRNIENEWRESSEYGWRFKRFAKNLYAVTMEIDATNNPLGGIIQTGAAINIHLFVKYPHRFTSLKFYHVTTAGIASRDNLSIAIARAAGSAPPLVYFLETLWNKNDIQSSSIIANWGEPFEYPPSNWTITTNTTATDVLIPVFHVQILEGV